MLIAEETIRFARTLDAIDHMARIASVRTDNRYALRHIGPHAEVVPTSMPYLTPNHGRLGWKGRMGGANKRQSTGV